jgi:hypothetical protein
MSLEELDFTKNVTAFCAAATQQLRYAVSVREQPSASGIIDPTISRFCSISMKNFERGDIDEGGSMFACDIPMVLQVTLQAVRGTISSQK